MRVYRPSWRPRRGPRATYLLAPGLHYEGPDDPRMDRFSRILASAGHLVVSPSIADYIALTPSERAKRDFERVFRGLPRWSPQRPVVFSISFGSLLALALAAEHGDALDGLVVFGGYADFHATMRFILAGEVASGRVAKRDPLNQAVVFANFVDAIDPPPVDRAALVDAWRRFAMATWGRPELKERARYVAIAESLAEGVVDRELFLHGVGARDGYLEIATPALARFDAAALDPTPYLSRIRCRVDLVHGTDDDVIPYEQSVELAARLPHARLHITGVYGHTGMSRPTLGAMGRELVTLVRLLRVLAR